MRSKSEAKRQAIMDVAAQVFREVGFERATMAEICQRVGGSKATIYNYFPSKEKLFFEIMFQSSEAEFHAIHRVLDPTTEDISEALRNFGRGFLTLIYSPEIQAARRLMSSSFGTELGKLCYERGPQRSLRETSEFLLAAMEKGKLRRSDPAIATLHLRVLLEAELIDSFFFQIPCDTSPEKIREIVDRAVAVFMAAYGPESRCT